MLPIPTRLFVILALSVPAMGQMVDQQTVSWPNTTGLGSPLLTATVHHPAVATANGTALAPHAGGWPVVVFLHGYGRLGADYAVLGRGLAQAGFVVVLSDTSQWDYLGQAADGIALHAALAAANAEVGGAFEGGLDLQRVALVGHSMGGANVANVLIANPGYRCGLALAPVAPVGTDVTAVQVPFGVVVGQGDWLTPWDVHALPYYQAVTNHGSFKFLHVLGDDCDHMNVAGIGTVDDPIFAGILGTARGFLQHCLELVDVFGLEEVFGPDVMADGGLAAHYREIAVPQMWLPKPIRLGMRARVSVAGAGGPAALLAASGLVPGVPTPFGLLAVDPATAFPVATGVSDATNRADLAIDVPADPSLVGLPVALQGMASAASAPFLFGNARLTAVQP